MIPEERGDLPCLRPGDVVRVGGHIGVITEANLTVAGCPMNWDADIPNWCLFSSVPAYKVAWRSRVPYKTAWWTLQEFDEVVSYGPFHNDADIEEKN